MECDDQTDDVTPPDSPDSFGIIGKPWAFFGNQSETTGSGALHFHVVVWGGLSPELLESVSDVPELCAKVPRKDEGSGEDSKSTDSSESLAQRESDSSSSSSSKI